MGEPIRPVDVSRIESLEAAVRALYYALSVHLNDVAEGSQAPVDIWQNATEVMRALEEDVSQSGFKLDERG